MNPTASPPKPTSGAGCLVLIAIAFIAWAIWPNDDEPKKNIETSASSKPVKLGLELIDYKAVGREYGWAIIGHVKNNAAKTYSYAQITFGLYDRAGNLTGSAFAAINNLESGGTWKFEALATEGERGGTFQFKELSGF